jgi:hypothetical protein
METCVKFGVSRDDGDGRSCALDDLVVVATAAAHAPTPATKSRRFTLKFSGLRNYSSAGGYDENEMIQLAGAARILIFVTSTPPSANSGNLANRTVTWGFAVRASKSA